MKSSQSENKEFFIALVLEYVVLLSKLTNKRRLTSGAYKQCECGLFIHRDLF